MKLSIKLRNAKLVRKGLRDLNAEVPQIGRQGFRTIMERIKRRMQAYPPEPPGQSIVSTHSVLGKIFKRAPHRYKRTGKFGASWSIDKIGNEGYALENTAKGKRGKRYGQYVVGSAYGTGQAWMHKGRWPVFRDVVEEEVDKMPDEIEEKVKMVARRDGFGVKP